MIDVEKFSSSPLHRYMENRSVAKMRKNESEQNNLDIYV